MDASSRSSAAPFNFRIRRSGASQLLRGFDFRRRRDVNGHGRNGIRFCFSEMEFRKLAAAAGKSTENVEEWRFEPKKSPRRRSRIPAMKPPQRFTWPRHRDVSKQDKFHRRCSPRHFSPQCRDTPPKRDTGIASEKDWGIDLLNEIVNESGTNEDGSTWYRESGEDLGENGYRCRWTKMGGKSCDGSFEWKEMWWEKSDWTGYKELGAEKSGRNAGGDSWSETWQEALHQDEWSNLVRIERSAQKQAKSGTETVGWYENWWEKYDTKGWTEKGAQKYGRLNDQSWWEKWGEHYDGRGSVLKWFFFSHILLSYIELTRCVLITI